MSLRRRHRAGAFRNQRGSVMLLVAIMLAALLTGGAAALYLQLGSIKAVGEVTTRRRAMYCAEAGLARARPLLAASSNAIAAILDADPSNDPTWYPVQGRVDDLPIDATNPAHYVVTVADNDDDTNNDTTVDADSAVFLISTCQRYSSTPSTLVELVGFEASQATCAYKNQKGQGCSGSNNTN
jgi:hypothetical protein